MPGNQRHLVMLLCVCLVIIGISAGIKIQDRLNMQPPAANQSAVLLHAGEAVNSDETFLADDAEQGEQPIEQVTAAKPTGIPGVTASAYLVGNVKTGQIYLEKNASRVQPVASMSKLVTAFVATDVFSASSTVITITDQSVLASPDSSNLMVGERFTLSELLRPLLLNSSNVAAEALSSTENQVSFMTTMRSYAWEVGMPHSFFADPSGISPQNIASAEDLFGLAKYLVYYRPDILTLTQVASSSVATTTEHGAHLFTSTHPFINDPRFIGGKTGRTSQAGETMLTILNINDQPIAFIILGAKYGARESDTRILLEKTLVGSL